MSTGKIISLIKSLGGAGGTGTSDLPFGTEVTYTEILPQESVTVAATEGSSALSADLTGLVPIEVGKKYRVTFDGVAYTCVAYKHASWGAICLGNGRLNGGSTEKTDEPFCINVWASTAASISLVTEGTHTVSVDEIVETHTPIQPEYLTGEKPQPYMQLVTDGEGKAGWEERLAWDESNTTELLPETLVEISTPQGSDLHIGTITESATFSLIGGAPYTVVFSGTSYNVIGAELEGQGATGVIIGNMSLSGVGADTGEPFLIVNINSSLQISTEEGYDCTVAIYGGIDTVHPIPARYIPTTREKVVFPERAIEIKAVQYMGYSYKFPDGFELKVGQMYRVLWDGTAYSGTAYADGNNTALAYTGWPFRIVFMDDTYGWRIFDMSNTAGTHVVEVIELVPLITPEMLPNPIPAEYLPTTFVPTAVIKSSDYDNALAGVATAVEEIITYECVNMTFEEAWAIVASGNPLKSVIMYHNNVPRIANIQDVYVTSTDEGNPMLAFAGIGTIIVEWTANGINKAE